MAEDKKPKIDLKARLGKKTVSLPSGDGSAIPPPVGIPKPSSGIPAPPFQSSKPGRVVDATDPYASISADQAPARAEPKAIKVEMSDEVIQAQKKARSTVIVLAAVTAAVGGIIGFAFGGSLERGKSAEQALEGASTLTKEIDAANGEINKLADALKNARQKLASSKYPEQELQQLGGIDIPFSGSNLTDKGIGRFKASLVTQLVSFASGAQEANDQKQRIQRMLGSKAQLTDYLSQQTDPKVRWSVIVQSGPLGPWGIMQALPGGGFPVKKDEKDFRWPEQFEIKENNRTFELKRYTGGDPGGKVIPVEPGSQLGVCPSDVALRLRREIGELEETLRGVKSDNPNEEKKGLIDLGQSIQEQLRAIGGSA